MLKVAIVTLAALALGGCSSAPTAAPNTPAAASTAAISTPASTPNAEATVSARVALTVASAPRLATAPSATTAPTAASAGADETPVTLSGTGTLNTPPFALKGGSYAIEWHAADAPTGVGCYHAGTLRNVDGRALFQSTGSGSAAKGATIEGATQAYNIAPGSYYLAVTSGCTWTVTVKPQ